MARLQEYYRGTIVQQLMENPAYKKRFQSLVDELPQDQRAYLEKIL